MSGHTRGDWHYFSEHLTVYDSAGGKIADLSTTARVTKRNANGILIAAAPELLDFLTSMGPVLSHYAAECLNSGRMQSAAELSEMESRRKELIAKAEGR